MTWALATIAALLIGYGAIAVAGSIFAGPTAAATSVRRRVAPVLNERPGVAVAGAVFLLLVLWGGTHALGTWWGIVLLGTLIANRRHAGGGSRLSRGARPEHWVRRTATPHPKYSSTSRDVKARSVPT